MMAEGSGDVRLRGVEGSGMEKFGLGEGRRRPAEDPGWEGRRGEDERLEEGWLVVGRS